MNHRPDAWSDQYFMGWPPIIGVHLPSPLPPEFRREHPDLKVPLREDELDDLNFWHIIP